MYVKTCCVNTVTCKSRLWKHVCMTWGIEHVLFDKSRHGKLTNQNKGYEVKVKIDKSHQQACVDETKTKEVNKVKNASKERWTVPYKTLGTNSQKNYGNHPDLQKLALAIMHDVSKVWSIVS